MAHPDYLYPLVCYIFFRIYALLGIIYRDILFMSLYLSTCVYKLAGMHTLVYEYTLQCRIFHRYMDCGTHNFFFCQYYFFVESPHFLNVSRMASHHIQHLRLGGDSLVKIVSPWETHDSGFCLNGFSINCSKYCLSTNNWKLLIHLYSCNSIWLTF